MFDGGHRVNSMLHGYVRYIQYQDSGLQSHLHAISMWEGIYPNSPIFSDGVVGQRHGFGRLIYSTGQFIGIGWWDSSLSRLKGNGIIYRDGKLK